MNKIFNLLVLNMGKINISWLFGATHFSSLGDRSQGNLEKSIKNLEVIISNLTSQREKLNRDNNELVLRFNALTEEIIRNTGDYIYILSILPKLQSLSIESTKVLEDSLSLNVKLEESNRKRNILIKDLKETPKN